MLIHLSVPGLRPGPEAWQQRLCLRRRLCHAVAIGDGYGAVEGAPPPMAGVPDWIVGYNVTYGGKGFDTKAMRTILRLRKKDAAERQEEEAILDLYMAALGMA